MCFLIRNAPIKGLQMYGGKIMLHTLLKHINEVALPVCILHLYVVFQFALMISIKDISPFYMRSSSIVLCGQFDFKIYSTN